MRTAYYLSLIASVGIFAGCATVPTELVDAREALVKASNGPAPKYAPSDLRQAREALAKAEESYGRERTSFKTRDLAYVAQRTAQLAEVRAETARAKEEADKATKEYQATQNEIIQKSKQQLAEEREKFNQEQLKVSQMETELAKAAAVTHEARGVVITLSGSVLFTSGQSTLLPGAQERLNQVAGALMEAPKKKLIVEGHTDSVGSDEFNLALSQRRADSVKAYLVSRGYDDSLVEAKGIGETRPIASNKSAEGRANNRRVEIVVVPDAK